MSLTTRQREILEFVRATEMRRGTVPTTREIQRQFRFASQTAAVDHLRALERKGALKKVASPGARADCNTSTSAHCARRHLRHGSGQHPATARADSGRLHCSRIARCRRVRNAKAVDYERA